MNRIITDKVKSLRALGRQSLSGHWQEAILIVLVSQIILRAPSIIYSFIPVGIDKSGIISTIFNVYVLVISGPITLSLVNFFIRVFRAEGPYSFGMLKYGFDYFGKALILFLRMMLFTWLWSLLFIIPGIIAYFSYSQSMYILADDPTKSPAKCMYESKFIMQGNKFKYLKLYLSYIGWYALSLLPALICSAVLDGGNIELIKEAIQVGDLQSFTYYATYVNPIAEILMFTTCIVDAYVYSAKAAFFDILVGRIVIKNVSDIGEAEAVS